MNPKKIRVGKFFPFFNNEKDFIQFVDTLIKTNKDKDIVSKK